MTKRFKPIEIKVGIINSSVKSDIKKRVDMHIQDTVNTPRDWGKGFGTTFRRNKEVVQGGFRNIVDLGHFRDGIRTYWRGNELIAEYGADHSLYVLYGYYSRSGKFVPGRHVMTDFNI